MSRTGAFDFAAFIGRVDQERQAKQLRWHDLADVLWQQSAELNERVGRAPI